jgi:hypothetical protein
MQKEPSDLRVSQHLCHVVHAFFPLTYVSCACQRKLEERRPCSVCGTPFEQGQCRYRLSAILNDNTDLIQGAFPNLFPIQNLSEPIEML